MHNHISNSKELPKYIKKSKVDSLLKLARNDNFRNYLIIKTLFHTGLRVSELVNLKKKDLLNGMIMVRKGKGDKDRTVPIDQDLEDTLESYTADKSRDDYLFEGRNGAMSRQNVHRIVKKYAEDIKDEVGNISAHTLRHSFAVYCLKSGSNLRAVQKFLGHTSLTTTQVYLDLAGEDLKEEHSKAFP